MTISVVSFKEHAFRINIMDLGELGKVLRQYRQLKVKKSRRSGFQKI